MQTLEAERAVVTGGSRGLGLGLVEALVARKAHVTVIARDVECLEAVRQRLGVDVIAGDITDRKLAESVLRDVRPTIVALNAGAVPHMAPIHMQSWEEFSRVWNTDVRATLQWIQAAIALPLASGSRVLIGSSGAAVAGSPLSGGYAGAKRMQWLMAQYANGVSSKLGLDIRFIALVPRQIVGTTDLGREAAEAYARQSGVTPEQVLAGFGPPLSPRQFGEHVATIFTDAKYANGIAFGIKGDSGINLLDAASA